ncbi:hypothetical protein [Lactococcus lactis]|uniref:hypothetical protein n=1 Tax=Lactococcus lactis TaxID=1358 RepID=UPI0015D521BA|nr:hypothetical protein [Lactococcus lactis]GFO78582.1 hypothetical protein LL1119B1_06380 [Lactococcus lactis]
MNDVIQKIKIGALSVENPFFDSLREAYGNEKFDIWLQKKSEEEAYVLKEGDRILGFLYLKDERESSQEIIPNFDFKRRLKIGTFKIDAHGTVLGQRFLSIILRKMLNEDYNFTYVTLFKEQTGLISLFEKFGFKLWGYKSNGELVLYKDLVVSGDIYKDFPRINVSNQNRRHLLSIKPEHHTKLFPSSRLNTEKNHVIEDLSFTNTSEKVYLTNIGDVQNMFPGDSVVIYRTKEEGKAAEYSAVASSLCTVVEMRKTSTFNSLEEFLLYCGKGTIFSREDLINYWQNKSFRYIIKLLYNVPLNKRIIRKNLIEKVGIERVGYWGYKLLSDGQFQKILEIGEVNESFIIN